MSDKALIRAPRLSVELRREMTKLADQRMLAPARSGGLELRFLGISSTPIHGEEHELSSGTVWKFVDHVDDPTAWEFGGNIPVPTDQISCLTALFNSDVRPQHIWIAHEMPLGYKIGDPAPRLVPAPPRIRETDERIRQVLAMLSKIHFGFLSKSAKIAAGATLDAIAGLELDPVVLGAVSHPELPLFAWCALAQWEWE